MSDNTLYLFNTNYYQRKWTWVKRAIALIVLSLGILILPLGEDLPIIKLILILLLTLYLLAKPIDDIAIDAVSIVYFKKSFIPYFSKEFRYSLSELTSIRAGGIHSDTWELIDFLNGGGNTGGFSNTLEMSFIDGSSTTLDLVISRTSLDTLVKQAYARKAE